MHISHTIWEYFINFIEIFLFYIFISTKLHATNTLNHLFLLQFLFLLARFAVLCIMNLFHISPTLTLCFTCFLEILFAFLFYTDSAITKFFWGFMFSAICIVADYIFVSPFPYFILHLLPSLCFSFRVLKTLT